MSWNMAIKAKDTSQRCLETHCEQTQVSRLSYPTLQTSELPEISSRKRTGSGRIWGVNLRHKDCDEWDVWIYPHMSSDFIIQWSETSLQRICKSTVLTSVLSLFVYSRDEHVSVISCDRCCAAIDYGSPRKVLELHVKYQLTAPQPALPARVGEGLTFCFEMPFWIPEQNTWALWSSTASSEVENNLIPFCPSANEAKGQTLWLLSPEILGRLP